MCISKARQIVIDQGINLVALGLMMVLLVTGVGFVFVASDGVPLGRAALLIVGIVAIFSSGVGFGVMRMLMLRP